MWLLLFAGALAAEMVVVEEGQTVASIAAALGDPGLAAAIRSANGLGPTDEPVPGTVLTLPTMPGLREHAAVVLALSGTGTAAVPGGGSLALAPGLELPMGSVVCTDPASYATVRLAVGDAGTGHDDLTLLGSTCLTVEASASRAGVRRSVVSVARGSVTVRTTAATPGEVAVRTDAGVTAGSGCGFRVHVEPGAARTEAVFAPVAVFGAGKQLRLAAGEGSRVRAGEAPGPVVRLLRGEALTAPPDGAELRLANFEWSPVEGGYGYRVEIAVSPDFGELTAVEDVAGPTWSPEAPMLPFRVVGWWWRVAPYDSLGFLGVPTEGRSLSIPAGVGP